MVKRAAASALALSLFLAACAPGITVTHLDTGVTSTTGVPWNLAMTQYAVTITRQVKSCDDAINGTVSISATAGKTQDPDQQYVLSSDGIWATSDITSTLAADGTSTGLNAHSENQAAQVVASVATLIAQGAILAAAAPGPHFTCSDKVAKALKILKPAAPAQPLKDVVDQETQDVTAATTRVTQLTTAFSGSKTDRKVLVQAIDDLGQKQDKLNTDQATLNANLKVVTHTQTFAWPPKASVFQTSKAFQLPADVLNSWIKWSAPGPTPPVDTTAMDVSLTLYTSDGTGGWRIPAAAPPAPGQSAAPFPATADVKKGVPIRLPQVGRLLACTQTACPAALPAGWTPTDNQSLGVTPDGPVLQLGRLYTVPITGGTFKSEGAVVALDTNGVPTSVEIAEKAAAGSAAASSAAAFATTAAAIPGQVAAARLARTQAETAQINAEAAKQAALASSPTAALTASANAQLAYINASNSLAAAQAASPVAAQTAAANAQLAYLTATNNLTAAQNASPTTLQTAQVNAQLAYLTAANGLATAQANAQTAGAIGQTAAQTALTNQQTALATAQANAGVTPDVSALTAQTTLLNAQAAQINAQVALAKAQAALKP